MALSLEIGGVIYRCADDYQITQQAGAVAPASYSVLLGSNPVPLVFQIAEASIDGTIISLGVITNVGTPEYSSPYKSQIFTVEVSSLEYLLNYRIVKKNFYTNTYPTWTDVIQYLFDNFIDEENITLGEISTTTKTYDGAYRVTRQKLSDVLNDIADKIGNATWYISPDRKFYFLISDDFPEVVAPTHISDFKVDDVPGSLRTVQTIVGASAGINGTAENATLKATIAARTGGSGKIEVSESDSSIHSDTKAATEAAARLANYAESEKTLSCLCHDLTKSALYSTWPISKTINGVTYTGDYTVVERRITHHLGDEVKIRVKLKNRNYFARYGYKLKTAANIANDANSKAIDAQVDHASANSLTKKIIAKWPMKNIAVMPDFSPAEWRHSTGLVATPDDFSWTDHPLIGKISRIDGIYYVDYDVRDNILTGTEGWVDPVSGDNSNDGLSSGAPRKTISSLLSRTSPSVEVVHLAAGVYSACNLSSSTYNKNFALVGPSVGKAIITGAGAKTYSLTSGRTYTYEAAATSAIYSVFDFTSEISTDIYTEYTAKASIDEVEAAAGSWYWDSGASKIYIHMADGSAPDDQKIRCLSDTYALRWDQDTARTIYMENILFYGGGEAAIRLATDSAAVHHSGYFYNVRSYYSAKNNTTGSTGDAFQLKNGTYILQSCTARYAKNDGFNYHLAYGGDIKAIEISCIGTDNGDGAQETQNGSSLHDGGTIIRINGTYSGNHGPNIVEISNGTQSLNYGCTIKDTAATASNPQDINFSNGTVKAWLIDCTTKGSTSEQSLFIDGGATVYARDCEFHQEPDVNTGTLTYQDGWRMNIDADLLAYWSFDAETGYDDNGKGRRIDWTGTPAYVTGKSGKAVSLSAGISGGFTAPALTSDDSFEFSFWFYIPEGYVWDTAADLSIIAVGSSTGCYGVARREFNNSISFIARDGSHVSQVKGTIARDTWYHVVFKYNGTTRKVSGILNGTSLGTAATALDTGYSFDTAGIIGGHNGLINSSSTDFEGYLDEVRFYERNTTAAEDALLYSDIAGAIASSSNVLTVPAFAGGCSITKAWSLADKYIHTKILTTAVDTFSEEYESSGAWAGTLAQDVGVGVVALALYGSGTTTGLRLSGNAYGFTLQEIEVGAGAYAVDTLDDISGNECNGQIYGAVPCEGLTGDALFFPGGTSRVELGDPTALQLTGAFSFAFFIEGRTRSGVEILYAKGSTSGHYGICLYLEDGIPKMYVSTDGTAQTACACTSAVLVDSCIVYKYEPGTSLAIDVNGVNEAINTTSIPSAIYDTDSSAFLGCGTSYASPYTGWLDGVEAHDKFLTVDESRYLYQNPGGNQANQAALEGTKDVKTSIPSLAPKYRGIGILAALGTAAFTGATVNSSGTITVGSSVTPNKNDSMINYDATYVALGIYYWDGYTWTLTTDYRFLGEAAIDLFYLTKHSPSITLPGFTVIITALVEVLFVQILTMLPGGAFFARNNKFKIDDTIVRNASRDQKTAWQKGDFNTDFDDDSLLFKKILGVSGTYPSQTLTEDIAGGIGRAVDAETDKDFRQLGTVTITCTDGSTSATVSDATNLRRGMRLSADNLDEPTIILGISGTTITLSIAATATGAETCYYGWYGLSIIGSEVHYSTLENLGFYLTWLIGDLYPWYGPDDPYGVAYSTGSWLGHTLKRWQKVFCQDLDASGYINCQDTNVTGLSLTVVSGNTTFTLKKPVTAIISTSNMLSPADLYLVRGGAYYLYKSTTSTGGEAIALNPGNYRLSCASATATLVIDSAFGSANESDIW